MTRRPFGGTSADFAATVAATGVYVASRSSHVTVWTAQVDGTLADITDLAGAPLDGSTVATDGYGQVARFYGPADGSGLLWVDAGGASRVAIRATDTESRLTILEAAETSDLAAETARAEAVEAGLVPKTTTVNGHPLSGDVTVTAADVGAAAAAPVQSVAGKTGAVSLVKADVGLGSVDNTADTAKPVSTVQQTALDAKVPTTRTVAGHPLSADITLAKGDVGLGNVDNTPDAGKPVSTATAAALAAKADLVGGVVPTSQLPALAISDTFTVASQAAMLALTAQRGDVAIRTDLAPQRAYMLTADDPTALGNWLLISDPTAAVTSVNGQTGVAVLAKGDVGLGSVDNTADSAKPVSTVQQAALDLKAPLASPALTGTPTAPTQTAGTNSTRLATTAYTDAAVAAQHTTDNGTYRTVLNVNNPIYAGGAGTAKSSAQNKTAIQSALDSAAALTTGPRILYFPDQTYDVDAGLTISSSSVEMEGGYGGTDSGSATSQTTLRFHFAAAGGTGTAITIGTDSGNPYDTAEYNGHSGVRFRRLAVTYADGATTETSLLNPTTVVKYAAACYGIRDWRGGAIVAEDLALAGWDVGFWGVQSDLNVWHRAAPTNCNVGIRLDARSDQNTFYDFFPYGNDTSILVDSAHQTRFFGASFVANGSATSNAVALRATFSRGCIGTVFDSCWFEQNSRAATVNSWISVGGFGTYKVSGVRIVKPILLCSAAGAGNHVNYFVDLNNCDDVFLDGPVEVYGAGVDYWFHIASGTSYAPHVSVRLTQPYNTTPPIMLNEGSGAPIISGVVAGNGDTILWGLAPRLRAVTAPAGQAERDWYIDAPSDDRWVVSQPGRADGNPIMLDWRRRFWDGGAAPVSGTWQAGDFVRNQSPTAGAVFGWRCVTGGTPGTWEALSFTSGGAAASAVGIYGDGSDGAYTLDGSTAAGAGMSKSGAVYTATRDVWATTVSISGGAVLDMAGFRLYAATSISILSGTIRRDGNAGSGATGGAALTNNTVGGNGVAGSAGGAGTTASSPTVQNVSIGASGGAGGAASGGGTGGGAAGAVQTFGVANSQPRSLGAAQSMRTTADGASTLYRGGQAGAGGHAAASSTGGGGGSGGGIVWICCPTISLNASGTISAQGGAGGAASGAGTGAGGGGGGGGGAIVLIYHTLTNAGTITVAGGAGGALQGAGAAGAAGSTGTIYQVVN